MIGADFKRGIGIGVLVYDERVVTENMTLACRVLFSVTGLIYNYSTLIPCPVDLDDIVPLTEENCVHHN